MSKKKKLDPDAPYMGSMTVRDMWEIFKVAAERDYDWSNYDPKQVMISMHQMTPHVLNGHRSDVYSTMVVPFRNTDGTYHKYHGFEAKFYEDGFFSYENGFDVMMRYSNPIKVHDMIKQAMNKQHEHK
mgnify:CR=1 FL=1